MKKNFGQSIKNGFVGCWNGIKSTTGKEYLLAVQHLFAMFGATILVPLLTGLNTSVALVTAGLGTLVFHLLTKRKVPVFLGSSFAFIGAISMAVQNKGVEFAQGGIIVAGLIYLLLSVIVYFVGVERIKKLFPPIVTGPIIVVIGMSLASVGIKDAMGLSAGPISQGKMWINILIAAIVVATVIFFNVTPLKNKFIGILKIIPILMGIIVGYIICAILGACGVIEMDYSAFSTNAWFNIPYVSENSQGVKFFSLPKFDWGVILSIAPIAFVSFMEHIGDITTNGAVVGQDFFKDPGLHRTVLGDGAATILAGFLGGPCNTTYSENTGVLASTKNYNPKILRWAAVFAIILGFFGKFGALLETIPGPVKGGIEIVLYGMISAIGIRTMFEAKVDLVHFKNIVIMALILVIGIGLSVIGGINIVAGSFSLNISGLFMAMLVGVLANLVIPQPKEDAAEGTEATAVAVTEPAIAESDKPLAAEINDDTQTEAAKAEFVEETPQKAEVKKPTAKKSAAKKPITKKAVDSKEEKPIKEDK